MPSTAAATAAEASSDGRPYRFDATEMALHWLTFLFVVTNYLLARAWGFLPRGSAPRHALQGLHVSFGVLFALVLAARLLWRFGLGRRPLPVTRGLDWFAANLVHYLLYGLLIAQAALGILWAWATPEGLGLFGLGIPSPASFSKAEGHVFGSLHGTIANVILPMSS